MRATHEWTLTFELTEHERFATDILEKAGEIVNRYVGVTGRLATHETQTFFVVGRDREVLDAQKKLDEVLRRRVKVAYVGRSPRSWRRYTLAPGIWSLTLQRDPGGWHVCVGRYCWTTEVESG